MPTSAGSPCSRNGGGGWRCPRSGTRPGRFSTTWSTPAPWRPSSASSATATPPTKRSRSRCWRRSPRHSRPARLAELAVLGKTQAVRSAAIDALRSRPLRDYVGMLVDQIHAPMRYQFEPVRGPGSPGALAIETPRYKMLRTYDAPAVFQPGANFYGYVGYDANGMPIIASGKELRRLSTEKLARPRHRRARTAHARHDRRRELQGHRLAAADDQRRQCDRSSPTPRPTP